MSANLSSSNNKELKTEGDSTNLLPSLSIGVLQEIGRRCKSKVNLLIVASNILDHPFCLPSLDVILFALLLRLNLGPS